MFNYGLIFKIHCELIFVKDFRVIKISPNIIVNYKNVDFDPRRLPKLYVINRIWSRSSHQNLLENRRIGLWIFGKRSVFRNGV